MPYGLLLVIAPLLLAHAVSSTGTFDIHTHDSYFIVHWRYIDIILAASILWIWILYRILENFLLSRFFTWAHIISVIVLLAMLYLPMPASYNTINRPKAYYEIGHSVSLLAGTAAIILILAHVLFAVNLIVGVARKFASLAKKTRH